MFNFDFSNNYNTQNLYFIEELQAQTVDEIIVGRLTPLYRDAV